MKILHNSFKVQSNLKTTFHDITEQTKEFVSTSEISNGIVVIYSQHTTCSVIIQEESHDKTFDGTKYLMQDMLDVFHKIIPKCRRENQYLHPGPEHIEHATKNLNEEAVWSLNTDAHLRSSIIGRSETIPLVEGELQLGEFGEIYFIDFDEVRARERTVRIQIMGE